MLGCEEEVLNSREGIQDLLGWRFVLGVGGGIPPPPPSYPLSPFLWRTVGSSVTPGEIYLLVRVLSKNLTLVKEKKEENGTSLWSSG